MSIVQHQGSSLAIEADQAQFTPMQVSALAQIGVDHASEGDLAVFFHVCQRSGLDPFAKQIYMIGRQVNEKAPNGEWVKVTKQTIQTGIDGFRLIGRRAADRARHGVSVKAPEWAHADGSWRQVWMSAWGTPVAARVTIQRGGEPFTAVALFDEYKQTKYGGELTSMWGQRPAGQLAKCAEALAWRMAFPQDLSGIYTDDEMDQADTQWDGGNSPARQVQPGASGADRMGAILGTVEHTGGPDSVPLPDRPDRPESAYPEGAHPIPPPESPLLNTSSNLAKAMYAAIKTHAVPEVERIVWLGNVIGREIDSSKDMTESEARGVLAFIEQQSAAKANAEAQSAGDPS